MKTDSKFPEVGFPKRGVSDLLVSGIFFSCAFRDLRFISFLAPQDLFLFPTFILLFFNFSRDQNRRKMHFYLLLGLFLCTFFALLSILVAESPIESAFNYLKVYVAFAILPSTIWMYVRRLEDVTFLINSFLIGVLMSCASSQILHIGTVGGRSTGLSGHAVFFGMLTSTAIVICLAKGHNTWGEKLLASLVIVFASFSLAKSASSTGLVNILSSLLIILIMNLRQKRFLYSIGIWLVPVSIFLFAWNSDTFTLAKKRLLLSLNPQAGFSTNNIAGTSTIEARIFSLKFGWERIKDSILFGHGLDTAGRSTIIGLEPHNLFVLAWQCGGVFLLTLTLVFLLISLRYCVKFIKISFTLGLVVSLVTWIGFLTEPLIYERSVLAPFFLVCFSSNFKQTRKI